MLMLVQCFFCHLSKLFILVSESKLFLNLSFVFTGTVSQISPLDDFILFLLVKLFFSNWTVSKTTKVSDNAILLKYPNQGRYAGWWILTTCFCVLSIICVIFNMASSGRCKSFNSIIFIFLHSEFCNWIILYIH